MSAQVVVVTPTRNRSGYLVGLLDALAASSTVPARVVVVDSSDSTEAAAVEAVCAGHQLAVQLIHTETRSAPGQRNIGAAAAFTDGVPDYLCFLDDDVRPAPDYLSRLISMLEADTSGAFAGASGTTGWTRPQLTWPQRLFQRIFLMDSEQSGALRRSGINVPVPADADGPRAVQWLFGCSVWRGSVLQRFRFRSDMPGGALYDDVELSARIAREYGLLVDPQAHLDHLLATEGRPDMRMHYHRWMRNRYCVVSEAYGDRLSKAAFWWCSLGTAGQLARHAATDSSDYRDRLAGLVSGAVAVLRKEPMT